METPPANPYATPAANIYGAGSTGGDAVSPGTIAALTATKPWVRFISVMMWIGVAFMLLAAVGMGIAFAFGASQAKSGPFGGAEMIVIAVVYGVMSFFYIYPALKLWGFANRIGSLAASHAVADLDAALHEQRRFWKFLGVLMIVMMCLYIVFIIGMVAFGASTALKSGALSR
ncbi:MAG: DUF5362 family protein [Verrucomicrobiaceae bacterium]